MLRSDVAGSGIDFKAVLDGKREGDVSAGEVADAEIVGAAARLDPALLEH
jgi:hypothetical protein